MLKKIIILILTGVIFYSLFLIYTDYQKSAGLEAPKLSLPQLVQPKPTVTIGDVTYNVEIADTAEKRTRGLSGRQSLPANQGMLFIFPNRGRHTFWMKDMNFPLDIIFIDGDTIVDIVEHAQPLVAGDDIITYTPRQPVDKVLEVNAGEVFEKKIMLYNKFVLKRS